MDQLKNFFNTRAALALIFFGILLAGLVVGVYLTQRQTQLKSQAAGLASCKVTTICGQPATGNTPSDCTLQCGTGKAVYHCIQSDNPNCVADISCAPDDAKCVTPAVPAVPPAPAAPSSGVSNCPSTGLENISNESLIANCTLAEIALLPNDRLMTFSMAILNQLPNPRLEQFPLDFLAKFSNDRLQQLSLGTLAKLPNERLQQFTIPFLQNFPNERLIIMSTGVLKQFPESRIRTFPCEIQIQLGYSCGASANGDNAGACTVSLLDSSGNAAVSNLVTTFRYIIRVTMTNTGTTTWDTNSYVLRPSASTARDWGISTVSLRNADAVTVLPNGTTFFDIPFTGPALTDPNTAVAKAMSFRMANGVNEFGTACDTGNIAVLPLSAAPTTTVGTACYVLSENSADIGSVTSCSDANAKAKGMIHTYSSDPSITPYTIVDQTPGVKTIYVRFISTTGVIADGFSQISYLPDPTVSAVACTQSATGTGTVIALAGTNFGSHTQQGAGTVTVNGTPAQITLWDPIKGVIQASVPTRLDGTLSVDLKIDDGRTVASNHCTIGVSTLQFTVNTQCTKPGTFSADNVDAIIVQNVAGSKPIIQTKINISKGTPQNFTPNLEANKNYSLILKSPKSLVKKVDFTTTQGTVNLGQVQLTIGDIAPFAAPDGAINSLDNSEMIRQWSPVSSSNATQKTASLIDHETGGIVNNFDWSCLKLGNGQKDDISIKSLSK